MRTEDKMVSIPKSYIPIAMIMSFAMAGASMAIAFRKTAFQLQISVFLFAIVVMLLNFHSGLLLLAVKDDL